ATSNRRRSACSRRLGVFIKVNPRWVAKLERMGLSLRPRARFPAIRKRSDATAVPTRARKPQRPCGKTSWNKYLQRGREMIGGRVEKILKNYTDLGTRWRGVCFRSAEAATPPPT